MAQAWKPDFVFRRNGRVYLNRRRERQFSRLLAAEVCASAVVMLDTPCSEVVWRVLANHSIRQFPLHFPSRASPCAIRFQLDSAHWIWGWVSCRASLGILEKIESKYLCQESNSIPLLSARRLVATMITLSRLSDEVQY